MSPLVRRLALPVIVLVAAAGYVAYWFHVADRAPAWVATWAESARQRGYDVSYTAVEVGGFPFRLDITVRDLSIGGRDAQGTWAWRGSWLHALLKPWDVNRVLVTLPPEHDFGHLPGGTLALAQGLNQTAVVVKGGAIVTVGTDIRDLVATDEQGRAASFGVVQIRYELAETDAGDAQRRIGVKLLEVVPARAPPAGFPATVAEAALVTRMAGAPPADASRPALERWRDDGGTAEVELLRLRWGPLDVAAQGTLTLDELFRPLGAFTVTITGYDAALAVATGENRLPPAQALALGAALDALAVDDGQGGRRAEVAVSAQDGRLYVGPLPVLSLPPIPLD